MSRETSESIEFQVPGRRTEHVMFHSRGAGSRARAAGPPPVADWLEM